MIINLNKASSRSLGVAQSLVGKLINEQVVYSKSVVLTGEADALRTENGHWCFMDSLRLLVRVVGQLTICLPTGFSELENEAKRFCSEAWLREMLKEKRTICSIVSEVGLQRLGVNSEKGFRPSVPFVATAAAAMVVAAALKALLFSDNLYSQRFTIGNLFLGPQASIKTNRYAEVSCICVKRRSLINSISQSRKQNRTSQFVAI